MRIRARRGFPVISLSLPFPSPSFGAARYEVEEAVEPVLNCALAFRRGFRFRQKIVCGEAEVRHRLPRRLFLPLPFLLPLGRV